MTSPLQRPLSILMIASEAVPFAKTGGLADVTAALTHALGQLGHDVTLVIPRYGSAADTGHRIGRDSIALGGRQFDVGLFEERLAVGRVILLDCPELYARAGLYQQADGADHADNAVRFAVLARAALDYAVTQPAFDIVHAHDWQSGLVPVYLTTRYARQRSLQSVATVFTIHNLGYQGIFRADTLPMLDLNSSLFTIDGLEFWGQLSFMKAGIVFSDIVTTVSEAYAREILTESFGHGLDGVLRARSGHVRGILNGIDTDIWNPRDDPFLPAPFSATDLTGKRAAKRSLLEQLGLPCDAAGLARPVIGMISRLVYQKGFDLVEPVVDDLVKLGSTLVVLGSGESQYETMWRAAAARHPGAVAVKIGYDEPLAHLIEGGADMFLMPSRYEPCGLNQMYSMRYGTVPIVRATGGLDDAVTQYNERTGEGTGFTFTEFTSSAMMQAVQRALALFSDHGRWRQLQQQAMSRDFSWTVSARAYVDTYRAVIAERAAAR